MDQLARLLPYVWRYRTKVLWSIVFAILVAGLWAATLSLTFLVVKVMLPGQSLEKYVATEIQTAESEIARHENALDELERKLSETPQDSRKSLLRRQDRVRGDISLVSRRMVTFLWIQRHVMIWVPADPFHSYSVVLGLLLLATALKGIFSFVQDMLVGSVVELASLSLRKDCFRHALKLDFQTLSLRGSADVMSRFTNDLAIVSDGLSLMAGKIVREPLKALACVIAALYVSWQLTLLSMVFVPLMVAVFHRYGKLLKRASHQMMERMSRIYKSLEETLSGLKVVIAYNGQRRHRQRFHLESKEYYRRAMKVTQIDALTGPTTELFGTLAVCLSLLPGAFLVLRHEDSIWGIKLASEPLEIGQLTVLYAFLAGVLDPVRKLTAVYTKLKRSFAATERIFELLDWQPLLRQIDNPVPLPRHRQAIQFKKVSFKYATLDRIGDRPAALTDVTLRVAAGEVVVIVGENGSGKSTLVNLLPRYCDPDLGSVLIDGIDIRNVRLRELRSQIGIVTQETFLFDDTIYENIRYGKPDATPEEIHAAAVKAHVPQLFDQLPEGFATRVGSRGNQLSGGQRQRVALARALLSDPSILLLDEATSAVDAQSEFMIHECLGEFVKGRTVFLITHSVTPQILKFATRIVIMEQGQLLAAGPHDELLRTCPDYHRLYRAQTAQNADYSTDWRIDAPENEQASAPSTQVIEPPHLLRFPPNQYATPEDQLSDDYRAIQ